MLLASGTAAARPIGSAALSSRVVVTQLPVCTIFGTAGGESIEGTAGDDVICALGGDDVVRGRGGDDTIFGSVGDDTLNGGRGNDRLFGWRGRDRLNGGRGNDELQGSLDADRFSGGPGTDLADYGERRRDLRIAIGGGANDGWEGEGDNIAGDVEDVATGSGDDVVLGNGAANRLRGGRGNDRLRGGGGNDRLRGGRGDDRLWGNGGSDRLDGRDGADFTDWLRCGPGAGDRAMSDAPDHVVGCERANVPNPPPSPPKPPPSPPKPPPSPPTPPPSFVNHPPTGVSLSPASVAENKPVGTVVGALSASDPDPGDTHSFALVPGAGSTDNGSFQIVGSTLRTAAVFDYETPHTYSVRIRATDHGTPAGQIVRAFTINVSDVNEAPSGLALSNATVPENEPAGTPVGDFSVTDPDAGQTHAFTLVPGAGDADNGKFSITGATLDTAGVLDFEAQAAYHIRVRATDDGTPALNVEDTFTITVADTLEPPTPDGKTASTDEDSPVTITLSASDPEGDDVTVFTAGDLSHGTVAPAGAISCTGTPNVCTQDFAFTPAANYNGPAGFTYTASDGTHVSVPATASITVNPVNDAPTALDGDRTTDEDTPLTLDLASLVSDVETADANLTYEIVAQPPAAEGSATATTFTPAPDFNGTTSLTYKVTDRSDPDNCTTAPCDGTVLTSTTETVSITVDPVNDAPMALSGSRATAEDTPLTLNLADLVSDVETADGDLTYEIVGQPGHGTATSTTYTPAADYNGPDSLTYKVTDRGDPDNCGAPGPGCDGPETSSIETVSVTVGPFNDTPTALGGSRTTDEDTPLALDLGSLVSDVETADGDLTYTIVDQPAHGIATATTYTPAGDYNGPDSLTYRVTDRGDPDNCGAPGPGCDALETSSTQTVSITVNPVNDTPLAPDASRTTDEDTPLAIDLAALASDLESADANLTYTVTQPGHGTVTGTGAARTYTPAANFNGTDTFTYTVTDRGDPDNCGAPAPACDDTSAATGTITITVGAVNDAPVNTLPAGPVAAQLNVDKPITGVSVADVDAGGDSVQVTLSVLHGTLTVSTAVPLGLVLGDVSGNGTGAVTITASLAKINTTLANATGLVYRGASPGPDTLTMRTDDLGHNGSGGARTDTDTLAIVVNSPPAAAAQSVSTNEDVAATVTLSATDADGDDPLGFAIGTPPTHGTLGAIGAVTCTHATPNVCTANVTYTPMADYNGPDSFTFTAADAFATSAPATVSITVNSVNDVPKLENIEAGALAYTENDAPKPVTTTTTVSDIDSANFDTGKLTVDYSVGGTGDDRLTILTQGQITVSGSTVSFAGTAIGTFTGGTGTTPLEVTLNTNATATATEALVRAVAYSNVSENPSTAARTVRFVLTDGDGGTSAAATRAITVTAVNDPPVLANIEATALAYTENGPATAVTSALTVTDPDSNITGATVTIAANLAPAEDVLAFVTQLGITGTYNAATGALSLTGTTTPANYQTALRAVTYRNSSENPSTLTRTVSFRVQDGPLPANLSNVQSRDVTVTAVNDAPVADDETFDAANGAIGNTSLVGNDPDDGAPALSSPKKTITADILAGDTDVEGQSLVVQPVTNQLTSDGGLVTIQADGDFTYTPKAGTSCTDHSDSFNYTVSDQNATGPGPTPGTDTGTVTIAIAGCVWYVNNTAAAGNGGTSIAPFNTIDPAESASGANDTVFVFDGNNSAYSSGNTGYTMNAGERLIGEDVGLTVDPDGPGGPLTAQVLHPANPGAKPTLTATGADVIDLNTGNEIRGFVIDPSGAGGGIAGGTGDTGATIDAVDITDTGTFGTQPGLELDGTTGTFNVSNLTVTTSGATGVRLNNAGTVVFNPTGQISITTTSAAGLIATGTVATPVGLGTSTFDSITVTGSGSGGVSLTNTTGTTTFSNLALTTTSGATAAFLLSNAGTVSVPAAGTANVSATGGPAVDATGLTGASGLAFDTVTASGTPTKGINLDGTGGWTFSAGAGSAIGATSQVGFDVNGGSGAVSYAGSIANGTGRPVDITGRSGDTTVSGNITGTGGTGINVSGNSSPGTTTFSGTTKTLNTGANAAVTLSSNTGHTIAFSGGGLVITTTTGGGFSATAGGTVTSAGPGNTITTGTGAGLNVTNTAIGSAGMNFTSINVDGNDSAPANGIVLNNTGTAGGLAVSGNGSAGSGGTVQDASGDGILLTTTEKVSLSYMTITSNLGDGIGGSTVNGFVLDNDTITNNGNDAASDESGINLAAVTGTVAGGTRPTSITNTTISNNNEFELQIRNTSGTLADFRMSGNTISSNGLPINGNATSPHGNLVNFLGGGTSVMTLTVTSGIFTGNWNPTSPPATITATAIGAVNQGTSHTVNVSGATFTNNNVGVDVSSDPINTTLTFNIHDNTFVGGRAQAINSFQNGNPPFDRTVNGRIQNNTIGTLGVAGSGSQLGNGISIQNEGAVPVTMLISGNTIQEVAQFPGISSNIGLGGAVTGGKTTNLTITNNVIRNIGSRGIALQENQVNPAQTPGPFPFLCANVSGNTFSGIAGQAGNGEFMRFRELNGTVTVTQATPTAAASPTEVDDANGFNDPTKVNISGGVSFSQPACPTPP
jgi:hypothetical protein